MIRRTWGWLLAWGLLLPLHPLEAQTRYVAFGDSVTAGTGDTTPEGPEADCQHSGTGDPNNVGAEAGYPLRLQTLLFSAQLDNRGCPGERTPEGLTRIDDVLTNGGDVLLLMEGTNDISRSIGLEATLFNLNEMARKAEAQGMQVVLATAIPRLPDAKEDRDNIENQKMNQAIRNAAGTSGRRLVDNFEIFSQQSDLFATLYWDSTTDPVGHPNAQGYDLMAETFQDVLEGRDRISPVPGLLTPDNGDSDVSGNTPISVDVWDFGAGVDPASVSLLVNGTDTGAAATGTGNRVNVTYQSPTALTGAVTVALRASDLSVPARTFDREIATFSITGTDFLEGDVDKNGRVDGADLLRLAITFGLRSGNRRYDGQADFNGDSIVDGNDLASLAANFGRSL